MELVRTLGVLMKRGWRPKRTIIIASWDAEEYGSVGSIEFTERYQKELQTDTIAYINVDHAVSGRHFTAQASPLLNRLLYQVTEEVLDPFTSQSVLDRWKHDRQVEINDHMHEPLTDPLSSNRDHVGFFHHLGIPSVSFGFRGYDYNSHHSLYDDLDWMMEKGDPTFEYHQTLAKIWGLVLLHLSTDEVLPFSPFDYAREISRVADSVAAHQGCQTVPFVSSALTTLLETTLDFDKKLRKLHHQLEKKKHKTHKMKKHIRHFNERMVYFERALLETQGIWYRHIIYGPDVLTGKTVTLPWVLESIRSKDEDQIKTAQVHLGTALLKAEKVLRGYFPQYDVDI
jgi:N-acetylated-alpha-linked acidic dipeptidase